MSIVPKMLSSLYKMSSTFASAPSLMMTLAASPRTDLRIACVIVASEYLSLHKHSTSYFHRSKVASPFLSPEKLGSLGVWYVFGDLSCVDALAVAPSDFGFAPVEKSSNHF